MSGILGQRTTLQFVLSLALMLLTVGVMADDTSLPLSDLTIRAEDGDADAQLALGMTYFHQDKDHPEAVKWIRKSAEQGHANAQAHSGAMHLHGNGLRQSNREAVKWITKAAEQDEPGAQAILGRMYYNGEGVPQDYVEAAKWTRKAAGQGHSVAQYDLA